MPARIDLPTLNGGSNGAAGVVHMRAIAEPALPEEGTKLGEELIQLILVNGPQTERAQSGRIGQESTASEWHKLRVTRGMGPLTAGLADLADAQSQPGLEGVQQRGLTNTGRSDERADLVMHRLAKRLKPHAGRGADAKDRVAGALKGFQVVREQLVDPQVDLVEADDRG